MVYNLRGAGESKVLEQTYDLRVHLGLCIRGPLLPWQYKVGGAVIDVSYPRTYPLTGQEWELPLGITTVLIIKWQEATTKTLEEVLALYSGVESNPLFTALSYVNQLFLAYKLAKINHIDTMHIRTVGEADALFHYSFVNDKQVGTINMSSLLTNFAQAAPRVMQAIGPTGLETIELVGDYDQTFITGNAVQHLSSSTRPISRRFIRCLELSEHGYYTEALIIAFSILDDLVQQAIHRLLEERGMDNKKDRNSFLRGIKERRLEMYLGPLLKVLAGKSIVELWPEAQKALGWINSKRNDAAHSGFQASRDIAILATYTSMRFLLILEEHGVIELDLDAELTYYSKVLASRIPSAPEWVEKEY